MRKSGNLLYTAALYLAIVPVALAGCVGPNIDIVQGSGRVITQTREVSGIREVVLTMSGTLIIEQAGQESLILQGEDNISPLIATIELGSRRVAHLGVTRSPTDEWTAQMERSAVLREATPFGEAPRFLIRDNDSKYGVGFTHVAVNSGIEVLRTPYKAPKANAFCERFLGSVRRECLDHVLILNERHLHRVVKEYV